MDWTRLESLKAYDLAQPLEADTPVAGAHAPFRMGLVRRHGDFMRNDGGSGSNELISMCGHTGTHIDAICHISQDGELHGGVSAQEAIVEGRYAVLGIDTVSPMICRGLLVDAAGAAGVESLAPAEAITAQDMERICADQGVEVRRGDVVLVRTGWPNGRYPDTEAFAEMREGAPGPDASAARWLVERGVRATGADTIAYEHISKEVGAGALPAHRILIQEAGIHIMEVLALEELARDKVFEFLFVAIPLRIVGATASPIRPLALIET